MKIKNSSIVISLSVIAAALFISGAIIARADEAKNFSYPVKELGGCKSESDCRTFCDGEKNAAVCINFAEKNGLLSAEDVEKARKFVKIGAGPGGCKGQQECVSYCEDTAHIDACLDFASKNNFISPAELEEAQKVAKALRTGAQLPGGCKTKDECGNYCNDLDHADECFSFAEKAGFIPPEELKEARMAVAAMKTGATPPGGCRNKKECDAYCSDPNNIETCFAFAEKAGLIPPEELEQARKIIPMMKAGKMPGGCKTKGECEKFCLREENVEACGNFAIEAGLMSAEDAVMFKKTGGKGPGNCRGKEQCETFCNDPANQEICLDFATKHDLIPKEQLEEMRAGAQMFKQSLDMATPEVKECIKAKVGADKFSKMEIGAAPPGREAGGAMQECFSQMVRPPTGGGEEKAGAPPSNMPGGMTRPPASEDIQKMMPEGVKITPEMMKKGPPSEEQIQDMMKNRMREEMQKRGAPPSGTNDFGPPENFPSGGPPSER